MVRSVSMSTRTRVNWLLDFAVLLGGVLAAVTGIQVLFHTSGGSRGGRNPAFDSRISLNQEAWNDLHTWGGVLMIIAAVVHFVYHWPWVVMMAKRMLTGMRRSSSRMSLGAKVNLSIDVILASSFFVSAISGIYFLFSPAGGYQGGTNPAWDFTFLWGRATWDVIHTWSGAIMIVAAVIHFAIHWRWIAKVTRRFFQSLVPQVMREKLADAEPV